MSNPQPVLWSATDTPAPGTATEDVGTVPPGRLSSSGLRGSTGLHGSNEHPDSNEHRAACS